MPSYDAFYNGDRAQVFLSLIVAVQIEEDKRCQTKVLKFKNTQWGY